MPAVEFKPNAQSLSLMKSYERGETPQKLAFVNATQNNRMARFSYEFESQGSIINGEYGYSILCKFIDPNDLEEFELIEQEAAQFLPKDIEYKSMLREEGRLFIKLQTKDGKFVARTDPPIQPDQLEKSMIHEGSLLDIEFQPNVWINFENRVAGIFLKISNITINGGKRKILKRR